MEDKWNDLYKKLSAKFETEAYAVDSSRYDYKTDKGFKLTSIKAQYIKERLNEVFGIYGWKIEGEHKCDGEGVLYIGKLKILETWQLEGNKLIKNWHEISSVGYAKIRNNIGDAYKSAMTDCLSKAASNIGVGNEVFKGNIDPNTIGNGNPQANKNTVKQSIQEVPNHDWVITFGKKFKGKRFSDCLIKDLDSYADFLINSAKDSGKELTGPAKEFVERVDYEMQR